MIQLLSHLEVHPYGFYAMTGFATTLAVTVAWAGLRKYDSLMCVLNLVIDLYNRLAKMRKVGLSSNSQTRKPMKPWLPLPLRNRTPGGWS